MLQDREKALVLGLWEKIAPQTETLGAEVLSRMIRVFPETRAYFGKLDMIPTSSDLQTQGGILLEALGDAIKNYVNLHELLTTLPELHMKTISVIHEHHMPVLLCIQIVLASHFPSDFNTKMNISWTKFLKEVADIISEHQNSSKSGECEPTPPDDSV
uniref:Globin domain-containing protein n=1 Tax=Leptobrachium leishanense TaxID=445787 RepID=A0A8C5N407_9ANUR